MLTISFFDHSKDSKCNQFRQWTKQFLYGMNEIETPLGNHGSVLKSTAKRIQQEPQ